MFGILTEVTIQCVPRHKLLERTAVLSREEVRSRHNRLLRRYKHLRYMWIPYEDAVVVVACNPIDVHDVSQGEKQEQNTDPYADDPDLQSRLNRGNSMSYPYDIVYICSNLELNMTPRN